MVTKYKITITKETILELASENEAKQVAEMLASRETNLPTLGGFSYTYSDYELVAP